MIDRIKKMIKRFPLNKNISTRCLQTARNTIASYNMAARGEAILVCVSGGPDSMALLSVLLLLAGEFDFRLGIAHVHHGLRKSADLDADFVAQAARQLNIPFYYKRLHLGRIDRKKGMGIQETAREARYSFFNEIADLHGFSRIATGHHVEDNVEQVMFRLIRGTGPGGICGIPPVRDKVIRPLIECRKADILHHLEMVGWEYVEDESNKKRIYTRNRIRHDLIPLMREFNPEVISAIERFRRLASDEEEWLCKLAQRLFDKAVVGRSKGRVVLDIRFLKDLETAALRRVIRQALLGVCPDQKNIGLAHVESIGSLVSGSGGFKELNLPGGITVSRESGYLHVQRLKIRKHRGEGLLSGLNSLKYEYMVFENEVNSYELYIGETGDRLVFKTRKPPVKSYKSIDLQTARLDLDALSFPLVVRNYRPADRFCPLGMTGTQKLKDFFINNKVAHRLRKRVPIVSDSKHIVWIAGFRIDNRVKIQKDTKRILEIRYIPACPGKLIGGTSFEQHE